MSVKWTCDYPGCTELAVDHKDWLRTEDMDQVEWWVFAVPFVGLILAFANAVLSDTSVVYVRHYCPTHAKFLKGDKP